MQIERLSPPSAVLIDGRPVPSAGWSYDAATRTVVAHVDDLPLRTGAVVTEIGGSPISSPEPAAVDLSIDPSSPLSLPASGSTTVKTTEQNDGPGAARSVSVALSAPSGWTVTPTSPQRGPDRERHRRPAGVELPHARPGQYELGAPYDGTELTITSWSNTSITFDLPPDSGSYPLQSGSVTVTVTANGQTSNSETITVTS